ncbi:DUF2716 domain-containing protein [Marinactinospora rubrisoli]|uniref:DUF2716 domain-containing protein n=1 Tax=Marinactinospora rubrisoli TaxID=2715399 RepID=A0ABW2KBJ0_9ACTN
MADDALSAYDAQVRGHVPRFPPVGAVVERDGPVVRTHYGTHGRVEHRGPADGDLRQVIRRQQAAFAERAEPVEWRVPEHHGIPLGELLTEAGFRPGWRRSVLVAGIDGPAATAVPSSGRAVRGVGGRDRQMAERVRALAVASGPHRTPLAEVEADGRVRFSELNVLALTESERVLGVGWAEFVDGTEFVAIGGLTGPHTEFLPVWRQWARSGPTRYLGWNPPDPRYLLAEADGPIRSALTASGFREITTVRSYHWTPPGTPATSRPVTMLFDEPGHDALWDGFAGRFAFRPSTAVFPAIDEPAPSSTWRLAAGGGRGTTAALDAAVRGGLRRCARPGESLYWLDWQHPGYRFDPWRVGTPGRPRWPGSAYPNGDYYLYLTADLRLGTFGHPWERTLCVFGAELLAEVADEITALLGSPIRRDGHGADGRAPSP